MQQIIKFIFSPIAFGLGFVWPLIAQVLLAAGLVADGWTAIAVAACIAVPWGLIAQFKGSWIWIK